jgi:ElaB/YqjD/DUF883 family membrane-anchored ribosome-binding protein
MWHSRSYREGMNPSADTASTPLPSASEPARTVSPEQVREDLRVLLNDAQTLLTESAKSSFHEHADETSAAIREKIALLRDAYARSREQAIHYESEAEQFVRDNPWTAVGGAFAVGLLFGCLGGRR